MRVHVDGTTHPIHDDVPSLSAVLSEDGRNAEIQVALLAPDYLHVVIAGQIEQWIDERGITHLRVYPTKAGEK